MKFGKIDNYDSVNHLVKQETSNSTGVIAGYTYTLDAGGKRVELLENNGRKVDYSYDKIDRLLTEQITDGTNGNRTTGYVYDAIGNRVSKTDSVAGVTTYVYDNNDRLLTETNGTKITTSTYDNNGNNLTRGDGSSQTVNTWDIENRLIQSVTDASTTIYQYDANGVRVSSQTNGVETRYLVDANRPHATVLMECDGNGNAIVDYTYGIGLISQQRGSVTAFYHADGLGSTRYLTSSNGSVTDTYLYDAYGNTLSSSGTTTNNYLYTGEQYDPNLREYYLRARYYDPSAGRFTGRDPFDGMLEEPLSLNKYAYVHGNPINNTDPTGMFALSEVLANDNESRKRWNILNTLYQECPFILTFNDFCVVIDRPCEIHTDRELLIHAEGKAAIKFTDGYEIYCNHGVSIPSEYGKVFPSCWKPSWILTKSRMNSSDELIDNHELVDALLTSVGYQRFCQELPSQKHLYWENYQVLIMRGIDRIEDWQYFYYYDFYKKEDFTDNSIDINSLNCLIKDINFRVSAELRYLYLIYNGGYQLAPELHFYPLQQAIENTILKLDFYILPLFHGDRQEIYYVLCDNQERLISHVYCQFPDKEPLVYAECVTSLIVTIAQCYQEGAYYIAVDEETGERAIEQDLDKIEPIFEKFNPDQIDTWRKIWKS